MGSRVFSQLIVCCVLLGCAGSRAANDSGNGEGSGSGIVIRSAEMTGSVLQTIRTRIPSVRISTTTGQCPHIVFRGDLSGRYQRDPSVYIDGTLMGDTCSLSNVAAHDVDRMEIYPSGNTPYSEIQRNPAGVIVIYRLRE